MFIKAFKKLTISLMAVAMILCIATPAFANGGYMCGLMGMEDRGAGFRSYYSFDLDMMTDLDAGKGILNFICVIPGGMQYTVKDAQITLVRDDYNGYELGGVGNSEVMFTVPAMVRGGKIRTSDQLVTIELIDDNVNGDIVKVGLASIPFSPAFEFTNASFDSQYYVTP